MRPRRFQPARRVEELKARCKADTSLDPPRQPVFQKWMQAQPLQEAAE